MTIEQSCLHYRYGKNKCKHHFERKQREGVNPRIYIQTCKISAPTQCSVLIQFIKWNRSQPNNEDKTGTVNQKRSASTRK